jgi:hypothetical protein
MRARQMAVRWRSPPERSWMRWPRRWPLRGGGAVGAVGEGGHADVFLDGEVGDQVVQLEDEAEVAAAEEQAVVLARGVEAADGDFAAVGAVEAAEEVEERALAGAGGAPEGDDLAGVDGEADLVEHGDAARVVALGDALRAGENLAVTHNAGPPRAGCATRSARGRWRRRRR